MKTDDFYCDAVNNGFVPCDVQCTFCLKKETNTLPKHIKDESRRNN